MDLQEKNVTVVGLGLHGGAVGTVRWLLDQGAHVTVTDLKTQEDLAPSLEALRDCRDVTYVLGQHRDQDFTSADLVVRNPGVPNTSPYLIAAQKAGVPIEMDSSLFFLHCPTKDIIGVTGSKGKTTAAKAITSVLSASGKHVVEVGTDGISPLGLLASVTADSVVVFELSSWRLEALAPHSISPVTAVVTSLLPDHLNTYTSMEAYEDAKKNITRFQKPDDTVYLNHDDQQLRAWEDSVPSTITWFSFSDFTDNTFGISAEDVPLLGNHQKTNVLPAIHIGLQRGMDHNTIQQVVASLAPIPHRLELVRSSNGVDFINNSTATIPEATVEAVRALSAKQLVVILGGGDKQLTFKSLAQALAAAHIRHIIWLPGTATEAMRQAVQKRVSVPEHMADSMQNAVTHAARVAQQGDVVLLSPGATSFGLFNHEFDRGDQFRNTVLALK